MTMEQPGKNSEKQPAMMEKTVQMEIHSLKI